SRCSASSGSALTSAVAASRTWLSVSAGLFPPQVPRVASQEEMANHRDIQVTHHGWILADFEMRVAQFALLVLQRALDGPPRDRHVQPRFQFVVERVPDEEPFFFVGVQRIVSPEELVTAANLAIALQPERSRLGLPDQRPFVGVFDVERRPGLTRRRPG